MVSHSSMLAWRIPWTEQPGYLDTTGALKPIHELQSVWTLSAEGCREHEGRWTGSLSSSLCPLLRERNRKAENQDITSTEMK